MSALDIGGPDDRPARVAFIGLGAMGARMAARLLGAGFAVTVWNRSRPAADALAASGASVATTPREAASGAAVVFTMVTDDAASRDVWLSPGDGLIAGLAPGAVAIESSTVTPAWITELAGPVHAAGASLIDAPVAGSRPQAESGQLIFMVGGDIATLDRVRPILVPLAALVRHVGPLGQGATLKLAVNALFAAQLASLAELLGLLDRCGIAPDNAATLLGDFPVVSPPAAAAARMLASGQAPMLFTIDLLAKDLGYLASTGALARADLPMAERTREVFERARAGGLGARNISALSRLFVR